MPATQQSLTSLPRSPQEDRHARMVKYTVAMSIRMVCILACLFLQGWWLAVAAVGAVVLPYFAVILANVGGSQSTPVERPGGVLVVSPRHSGFPPTQPYSSEPSASDPRTGVPYTSAPYTTGPSADGSPASAPSADRSPDAGPSVPPADTPPTAA